MSFILDALKKVEQNRRRSEVPDITTLHVSEAGSRQKRALWPYLILIALVLNAGIIMAWLRPWVSDEKQVLAQENAVTGLDVPAPETTSITRVDEQLIAASEPVVRTDSNRHTNPEIGKMPEIPAPMKSPEGAVAANDIDASESAAEPNSAEEEAAKNPETVSEALDLNPSPEELVMLRNTIKAEQGAFDNLSVPDVRSSDIDETDREKEILLLSELPEAIRSELPPISINGHIYSNNPASRLVNVNGQMAREGDTIDTNLSIEEITLSGVVFYYQGFRFRVRAL